MTETYFSKLKRLKDGAETIPCKQRLPWKVNANYPDTISSHEGGTICEFNWDMTSFYENQRDYIVFACNTLLVIAGLLETAMNWIHAVAHENHGELSCDAKGQFEEIQSQLNALVGKGDGE